MSAENLRFPGEGSSAQGKSGPKPRPRGVGDGQRVDIPVPPHPRPGRTRVAKGTPSFGRGLPTHPVVGQRWGDAGRQADPGDGCSWGKHVGGTPRKIRGSVNPEVRCRAASGEAADPTLPRKSSSELVRCPYRKPTQVDRQRMPRRSSEPWLRNSAKCPRNFGRRGASVGCRTSRPKPDGAAETRPKRLFTKNTGACEAVRRCICTDACPVPER